MSIVPADMKLSIGKIAALHAVATDPGHILILTRSLLGWVRTALMVKFDGNPSQDYNQTIDTLNKTWREAMAIFGSSNENWPVALMMCADIATETCIIAGREDLMDYKEFDFNLTSALYGTKEDDQDGQQQGGDHYARTT
jgi:hypothetical protein